MGNSPNQFLPDKMDFSNLYNSVRPMKQNSDLQSIIPKITPIIANKEGFRDTAYKPTPKDHWTIGYGSTQINGQPVQPGQTINHQDAQKALQGTINGIVKEVAGMVKVPLKPHQLAALTSFAYNTGTG